MRLVAALVVVLSIAGPPAWAQTDEIIVLGRPLPRALGAEAYASVSIDAARLDAEASGRLEQVLRDVAGFQTFRRADSRAANPTAQGATLRALGGNAASRALVLLDGVPQADPFAGWIAWPALDPGRLAGVRVTRGGGAGPLGAGALTGVIELDSANLKEAPRRLAELAIGDPGAVAAAAAFAEPFGEGFFRVSARHEEGDGYVLVPASQRGPVDIAAAYSQSSLSGRVVQRFGDVEAQANVLAFTDDRLRGLPGADIESDGLDGSLRLVGRGALPFEALVYAQDRRFASRFVSADAARQTATVTLDQFDVPGTGYGAKFELRPQIGDQASLQMGVDGRRTDGETRERFRLVDDVFTRERRAGGRTDLVGAFVEVAYRPSDRLTLTGGARADHWSIEDGQSTERDLETNAVIARTMFDDRHGVETSARGGVVYALTDTVSLRSAAYSGFRLPTLNELYRPFRVGADVTAANAALAPERIRGAEIGIDVARRPWAQASVTVFRNDLEDAIANVTRGRGPGAFPGGFVPAGGVYRERENVEAIEVAGLELSARAERGRWSVSGSYAFTDADVRAPGLDLDGARPAQTPRHAASLTTGLTQGPLRLTTTLRHVGAQFEDDLESRTLAPATTLDAFAAFAVGDGIRLELRGENLTDETIEAGVSGAGIVDLGAPRTLWFGLRLTGG